MNYPTKRFANYVAAGTVTVRTKTVRRGRVVRLGMAVASDLTTWRCDRLVLEHLPIKSGKAYVRRMVTDAEDPRLTWNPPSYPEAWAR